MKKFIAFILLSLVMTVAHADIIATYRVPGPNGFDVPKNETITNKKALLSHNFVGLSCGIPAVGPGERYHFSWMNASGTVIFDYTINAQGSRAFCGLPKQHWNPGKYSIRVTHQGQTVFSAHYELIR